MERGTISVISNLGELEHAFPLPRGARVLLASRRIAQTEGGAIVLPPDSVAVLADRNPSEMPDRLSRS